jgi:hypothetical protein
VISAAISAFVLFYTKRWIIYLYFTKHEEVFVITSRSLQRFRNPTSPDALSPISKPKQLTPSLPSPSYTESLPLLYTTNTISIPSNFPLTLHSLPAHNLSLLTSLDITYNILPKDHPDNNREARLTYSSTIARLTLLPGLRNLRLAIRLLPPCLPDLPKGAEDAYLAPLERLAKRGRSVDRGSDGEEAGTGPWREWQSMRVWFPETWWMEFGRRGRHTDGWMIFTDNENNAEACSSGGNDGGVVEAQQKVFRLEQMPEYGTDEVCMAMGTC